MTWALKRQIFYLTALVILFLVFAFILIYPSFNKPPTCVDGKQNGDEVGIDCGGSCARVCLSQVDPVSVLWARSFEVVPGRYNAVAYLENQNKNSAINKINYKFRFADEDNIYIGSREGSTFVPPSGRFAIFEPAVNTGYSVPVYTTLEFTEPGLWVQVDEEKMNQLRIIASNIKIEGFDTMPRLLATISNKSLFTVPTVNVVAILYDDMRNAISVSKTTLTDLGPESSREASFTWPKPFGTEVVTSEVIPMFNIFGVKLE